MVYEDEEEVCEGDDGEDDSEDGIECDDDDDDLSPYKEDSLIRPPTGVRDNDSIAKQRRSKNLVHMNVEMMMDKDHPKTLASHAASYDSMIDIVSPTSPLDGPWF